MIAWRLAVMCKPACERVRRLSGLPRNNERYTFLCRSSTEAVSYNPYRLPFCELMCTVWLAKARGGDSGSGTDSLGEKKTSDASDVDGLVDGRGADGLNSCAPNASAASASSVAAAPAAAASAPAAASAAAAAASASSSSSSSSSSLRAARSKPSWLGIGLGSGLGLG